MMKQVLHNCAIRASSYAYASVGTHGSCVRFYWAVIQGDSGGRTSRASLHLRIYDMDLWDQQSVSLY